MFWITVQRLKSGAAGTRKKAAQELWREANPRALKALSDAALTDPDAEVRQVAASALGRLRVPERLDPLLQALQDKEPDVVRSAVLGLRGANDDRIIHKLIPLLRHQDYNVRTSAAQAIDTMRWAPPDREQRVWFCVAKGWFERAAQAGSEAMTALKLTAETAPVFAAVRAVEAMGKISDPGVVKMLTDALRSPEPAVCIAATDALGKVGGSEAVTALIPCLKSVHTQIRAEAARALGILGAAEASMP